MIVQKQMPPRLQNYIKNKVQHNNKKCIKIKEKTKTCDDNHYYMELISNKTMYIISNIGFGGTFKYFTDLILICGYFNISVIIISNKTKLLKYMDQVRSSDIILLQQVLQPSDITQDLIVEFLNSSPKGCYVFLQPSMKIVI